MTASADIVEFRRRVLEWGENELRDLPWRRTRDPWVILVSETMLQQTQVARVIDRLPPFLGRFPDASACAEAAAGDVIREWAGLGYNRRAVMLHSAATMLVAEHDARVPSDLEALLGLPGVGPYTARAIRAFAFELPSGAVDTNIGRVLARLEGHGLRASAAQELADELVAPDAAWLWNQALMEIGALICTKRSPRCGSCPVAAACAWRGRGDDPAVGSASVSRPQPRFAGSDRQLRGRLVERLRAASVPRTEVHVVIDCDDAVRVDAVVDGLIRDALIVEHSGQLQLS